MRKIILMHALLALVATSASAAPHKAKMKGKGAPQQQAAETAPADAKPAEDEEEDDGLDNGVPRIDGVTWTRGPAKAADLGNATVDVPEGFAFTGIAGTRKFLEATGNLPGTTEKGTLWKIPTEKGARTWFVIYDYDDSGHVADEDKDLDADDTLKGLTENNEAGNEERKQRQLPPLHIIGWYAPPHYDEQTHNLEWATRLQNEESQRVSINYEVRLLGRTGVMSATLVGGEQLMDTATPEFKSSLKTFAYKEGDKYGEYKKGDKLAAYGIAGLIGAGGLAVAAKAGLLSKLGVFIAKGAQVVIVGVIAVFGAIGNWIKSKFSKKSPPANQ